MTSNPFEDPDGTYLVLVNADQQHSLWPVAAPTPDGWTVVFGAKTKEGCISYINENWTDLRRRRS